MDTAPLCFLLCYGALLHVRAFVFVVCVCQCLVNINININIYIYIYIYIYIAVILFLSFCNVKLVLCNLCACAVLLLQATKACYTHCVYCTVSYGPIEHVMLSWFAATVPCCLLLDSALFSDAASCCSWLSS